jgi:nitrate/TMAO reductase-like tetraheme cytochrome c subunit
MLRALSVAAVLLAPLAAAAKHPAVEQGGDPDACLSCHREATPQVVKEWEGSQHGLVLVKCFVCHGSTGKDFTRAVAASRCGGCHADQAAAIVPAKARAASKRTASCFDCHSAHSLAPLKGAQNPHLR